MERESAWPIVGFSQEKLRWSSAGFLLLSLVLVFVLVGSWSVCHAAVLSEGRAYEQVSPVFKNGYSVFPDVEFDGASEDGEAVYFNSIGAFSGSGEDYALNPYVADRTPSGWVTKGLFPPPLEGELLAGLEEMTPDLGGFEFLSNHVETASQRLESSSTRVWVRDATGHYEPASPILTTQSGVPLTTSVAGAAIDFSRFILTHTDPEVAHLTVVPTDKTVDGGQLFEVERPGVVRLVAVNDAGEQLTRYCEVALGGPNGGYGAVSQPDAAEVFFSVPLNTVTSAGGGCKASSANPEQLLVRVDGAHTLDVSVPLTQDCTSGPCLTSTAKEAIFQGASEDGKVVYFTTAQSLVNGDEDGSNDLYAATIARNGSGEAEVTSMNQVSHDPNAGEAAEVQGPEVTRVSRDGSHVYFVAHGVLTSVPNGLGQSAVKGAANLYVYDRTDETVSFVADLCTDAEQSGGASDPRCPVELDGATRNDHKLWGVDTQEAQTTQDGRFLVFSTFARLISQGPEADTDTTRDLYRYDSVTGGVERVSLGEGGLDGNGNNDEAKFEPSITTPRFRGALQEQYGLVSRDISDNGSTIVLSTAEPISGYANNGVQNIYVWHEGSTHLISSGTATTSDVNPLITPSGTDIFFITTASLVPTDVDSLGDVYDARIGGGFPLAPTSSEECLEGGCRRVLSEPVPLLVPASTTQPPGDNVPEVASKPKSSPVNKKSAVGKKKKPSSKGKRSSLSKGSRAKAKHSHGRSKGGVER